MKKLKYVLLLFLTALISQSNAQKIATLEVELTKPTNGIDVPVSTNLDKITNLSINKLNLVEITNGKTVPIPIQVDIKTKEF